MDRRQISPKVRERRLRAKYRRKLTVAIIVCLIIGLAGGFVLGRWTAPKTAGIIPAPAATATATPVPAPTMAPTPVPQAADALAATPVVTVTPTAAPVATPEPEMRIVRVPFGSTQAIYAQIRNDGTTRTDNAPGTFETVGFSLCVTRYLTPEYYEVNYASKYQLQGNDACVEFELTLNDYMGSQTIVPQSLFTIGLETAGGVTETGFQLTDAEIYGQSGVTMTTNIPKMVYKRFKFDTAVGDMAYLTVTAMVDGVTTKYMFELGEPVRPEITPTPSPTPKPATTLSPLGRGDENSDVMELQEMLIELGYLTGKADGNYGAKTEAAVKAAQAHYEMTETGTANHALIMALREELGID